MSHRKHCQCWQSRDTHGPRTGSETFATAWKHTQCTRAVCPRPRINHHRLDIDRIAVAHCQCAIPPIPRSTRKQAISALADEFYEYMSGLINDPPDNTVDAPDQLSNHRVTQLEQELAATKALLQTRHQQNDRLPHHPTRLPPPHQTPTHHKDFPFSPPKIHLLPFQLHLPQSPYKTAPHPASNVARFQHSFPAPQRSPPPPTGHICFTPRHTQWFSQNYTGAHSDAGIQRWIGALKIPDNKQEMRQHTDELLRQYPQLSAEQLERLQKNAEAWGLPQQHIRKLQASHLIRILGVISHFTA